MGVFSLEENHVEEVLSQMETEFTYTQLQLQSAQEEIVCLRKELSAQQERLLEAQEVIKLKSACQSEKNGC